MINKITGILAVFVLAGLSFGQTPQTHLFRIDITDYAGKISGDYRTRDRQFENAAYQGIYNRALTRGSIELQTRGSIYHPDLFDFILNLDLGFNHSGVNRQTDDTQNEYDKGFSRNILFRGSLLGRKPLNLTLEYLRQYQQLNREFFYVVNAFNRKYGARLNWNNPVLPVTLGYSDQQTEEYFADRQIIVTDSRWEMNANYGTLNGVRGGFTAGYSDYYRLDRNNYRTDQNYFRVQHNIQIPIGSDKKHQLYSNTNFSDITGTREFRNFLINANSVSSLSPDFSNRSRISYRYYDTPNNQYDAGTVSTQFRHQLYESLTTSVGAEFRRLSEKALLRDELEITAQLDYQKSLPAGTLFLNLGYQPNWIDLDSKGLQDISGEMYHSFADQNPVFLPQRNIIRESIQVLSPDRIIDYIPGEDFEIQVYGDSWQLLRLPGSTIPDSAEVLIRYTFVGSPDQKSRYAVYNYGISYRLSGAIDFSIGYQGFANQYADETVFTWWNQDDKNVDRYYIRIDYKPVTLDLSRETSDSKITPYTTDELSLKGILGSYINQYLMARVHLSWQDLPLREARQTQTFYQVEVFRRLSRSLRMKASWHERSIGGDLNDMREERYQGVIKYELPNLIFNLEYNYFINTFYTDKETNQRWIFSLVVNP